MIFINQCFAFVVLHVSEVQFPANDNEKKLLFTIFLNNSQILTCKVYECTKTSWTLILIFCMDNYQQ